MLTLMHTFRPASQGSLPLWSLSWNPRMPNHPFKHRWHLVLLILFPDLQGPPLIAPLDRELLLRSLNVGSALGDLEEWWSLWKLRRGMSHRHSLPFTVIASMEELLSNIDWLMKQVKDINILLEIHKGVRNTKNNQFVENMGLKNKPNLKIKTVLTQKNEFILEASNFRFNCVDLSFFSPVPFSIVLCWKRLRAAWALIYLVWQKTPMLPEKTSQLLLTSSAIKGTWTSRLKFHPHTSKKWV